MIGGNFVKKHKLISRSAGYIARVLPHFQSKHYFSPREIAQAIGATADKFGYGKRKKLKKLVKINAV